jgi:ABC-type phosphate/phosphonate transport system substrate-binding protein
VIRFNKCRHTLYPNGWVGVCTGLILIFLTSIPGSPLLAAERSPDKQSSAVFHFGFSSSMITDVSQNDVEAAMRVWAQELTHESGFPMDTEPKSLTGLQEIFNAVRDKSVDAIALTTPEYWRLKDVIQSDIIITAVYDDKITEQYVLLVHRNSRIESLSGLQGCSLGVYQSPRMSLASIWLDVQLSEKHLGPYRQFCHVTESSKLSRVVLPVFFRKMDACLVTRRGYATMTELNPQLGRQLKVLATSPAMVPAGLCFRGDYAGPMKDRVIHEASNVHTTPAGQQILTIFRSGNLEVHPITCLNPAFELLKIHARLLRKPINRLSKRDLRR